MNVWTAVILSSDGQYHGTSVATSEEDLIANVREQFDPEGEWEGEFSWDGFADFFAFRIYPNPHELQVQGDLPPGYRWADADEMERIAAGDGLEHIVVPRTADANGKPYTQGEADIAVPITDEEDQ